MCSSCLISISNSVSLLIFCLTTMCCIGVWFPLLVSTCSGMFFSLCAPLCLRRFISCVCLYTKLSKPLGLCVSGSLCFCARRTSVEDSSNNNNKKGRSSPTSHWCHVWSNDDLLILWFNTHKCMTFLIEIRLFSVILWLFLPHPPHRAVYSEWTDLQLGPKNRSYLHCSITVTSTTSSVKSCSNVLRPLSSVKEFSLSILDEMQLLNPPLEGRSQDTVIEVGNLQRLIIYFLHVSVEQR